MKHVRKGLFMSAAGAVCLFGCSQKALSFKANALAGIKTPSIHVLTDRAKEAPVSGSFGWGYCFFKVAGLPGANLSAIDERLHASLRAELARKGLVFKASEPDVLVSYALADGAAIDDEELNRAYGELLDVPASDPASALYYKRGVLVLDIVERKAKHLLWRGAIMAEIDMSWPEERKQERCNAVIGELLRYYPHP